MPTTLQTPIQSVIPWEVTPGKGRILLRDLVEYLKCSFLNGNTEQSELRTSPSLISESRFPLQSLKFRSISTVTKWKRFLSTSRGRNIKLYHVHILRYLGAVNRVWLNGGESFQEWVRDATLNVPFRPRLIRRLVTDWAQKIILCPIGGQHLSHCFRDLLITCYIMGYLLFCGPRFH